jgi:hypothetical protein
MTMIESYKSIHGQKDNFDNEIIYLLEQEYALYFPDEDKIKLTYKGILQFSEPLGRA